ncbi:MAG: RNA polymerase sigma factor, partial [Verrucomicrobiota bacterium]|nr:RNA polymerase sigma factor [Verrucomicrobiota bacterium]
MMTTEMTDRVSQSAQQDESAVAAVRSGDAERYRELVERHERRVYAVAWSRLGDAALAEEATQEAFIRAYRRLWLLGDGAKFSGWVNTIARRVAINFGLSHRRELNKRERWGLENFDESPEENCADETDSRCTSETLQQTLAELPDAQRECLVLFYLEGKSGTEAATALGISEAALRVRLHRARAAMRERLEEKLEGSLAKLRPAKSLVPAIMAGVLASSSAKAATASGVGVMIFGTLAKFTPFKWLFAFFAFIPLVFPLVMILPGLFFHRWRMRDEQQNYRDAKGFRARLHSQFDTSYLVFFVFLAGMILFFVTMATRVFSAKHLFIVIGFFMLVVSGFSVRQFEINCSRYQIVSLISNFIMTCIYFCIGLGLLPIMAFFLPSIISSMISIFANRSRPPRMDYNLFLRATQGMFPLTDSSIQKGSSIRFDRATLRAFARFLGERQLVNNFRWKADGLTLYLLSVKSPLEKSWVRFFPSFKNNSNITLGWNGLVTAHCRKKDAAGLQALRSDSVSELTALENQVALAVAQAWQNYREGKITEAERTIGQISENDIFIVPPSRTKANRWQKIIFGGFMTLSLILLGTTWLFSEKLSGLKPVSISEAEVRTFLNHAGTNPNPITNHKQLSSPNNPNMALFICLVLPETNLFSAEGLQAMRTAVFSGMNPQVEAKSNNYWLC